MTGLPTPTTEAGRAGLAALLRDPGRVLLATDYDGTLAAIVPDPARALPEPGALEALSRLAGRLGTVAVITGRPVATALALGRLDQVPGLYLLGAYGAQRWHGGEAREVVEGERQPVTEQARAAVRELVDRIGPPGTAIEDKGSAVAVHVRGCADPATAQALLSGPLVGVAEAYGLAVEPGRLVIELRPPGSDKGSALRALAEEVGAQTTVFIGDDLGDLAAFAGVAAMRREGGAGLTVASVSTEAPRVAQAADLVVDGPAGVVAFLVGLADQLDAVDRGAGR